MARRAGRRLLLRAEDQGNGERAAAAVGGLRHCFPARGGAVIIAQPQEQIAAFVALMQGLPVSEWGQYSALGLVKDGYLVAGVVCTNWAGAGACAHIGAVAGRRWLDPAFLRAM